jgi:hypothetical protein
MCNIVKINEIQIYPHLSWADQFGCWGIRGAARTVIRRTGLAGLPVGLRGPGSPRRDLRDFNQLGKKLDMSF